MKDLIDSKVRAAKSEMEEEIRSGLSGKILGEEELQGTPTKKPKKQEAPSNAATSNHESEPHARCPVEPSFKVRGSRRLSIH